MATPTNGAGFPKLGPLYIKQTSATQDPSVKSILLPGVIDIFGDLSVTSQFKVSLHLNQILNSVTSSDSKLLEHLTKTKLLKQPSDATIYDFYCSEASLPGVSLNTTSEAGSRQGVVETIPTHRIYPPIDITFYVDKEFRIIRIFEEWMNFINPVYNQNGVKYEPNNSSGQGNYKSREDFFRLRYPNDYKRIISITKFEREFRDPKDPSKAITPSTITYRLIDAYPDNISAIPVTYQGSEITKANIRFAYTRYVIETNIRKNS